MGRIPGEDRGKRFRMGAIFLPIEDGKESA